MDLVIGMRGTLVEEGHIPKTIIEAMENAYKHRNPWGIPKNKRTEWTKTLPEEIKVKDFSQGDRAKYLYFVGCTASSDPRIQEIAKALAFSLQQAEVDFGILGNEEQCCGNEIRRMGEAGLFEELVEENVKRLNISSPCARMVSMC
jgi:Fe-S oxidoreductase